MLSLGAGNGAVFQLVPQRFRKEIGVMTGLIGMAGGIGGFALTAGLGAVKQGYRRLSTGPLAVRRPRRARLVRLSASSAAGAPPGARLPLPQRGSETLFKRSATRRPNAL